MDSINIIQPSAFIFFILVITIGYILVEIVWWENYLFRSTLNRYAGSNIIDRLIHYSSIGILFHFSLLIIIILTWKVDFIEHIISTGYKFAQDINFIDGENHFEARLNTQLVVSALVYFVYILIGFILLWVWFWFWKLIFLISSLMRSRREPPKKIAPKKPMIRTKSVKNKNLSDGI